MIIKNEDAKVILNKDGIVGKRLLTSTKNEFVRISIEPGFELEPHAVPFDAKFYLIDGEGILTIGEDSHVIKRDTLVECDKHVKRGWKNLGARTLEILVIKNILP